MSKIIFFHRVEITDGKGIIKDADGFSITQTEVIAENKHELVIEDIKRYRFVVISKSKSDWQCSLNEESISFHVNDTCFGNRVTYQLYSEHKKPSGEIRAAIEAEIKSRFGLFINKLDLDCIREDA